MKRLTGLIICAVLINVSGAFGVELPSLTSGQQLFMSEKLGTSGMSCSSCHSGGKKLMGVGTFSDEQLAKTINRCIAGSLKGKPLDPESSDMKSLVLYLKSFAGTGK
jgi:cytochrome c